jgi:hypothetical protein
MPASAPTEPVHDSVSKVNDELAVGSDLEFQRRWWKFERGVWIFFTLILVLDVLGVFGRGPLAKARMRAADASAEVIYERVERHATPSYLTVRFGPSSVHEGKVRLWVSESLIKVLGNQRVSPQPESSMLESGGVLYTFPAGALPLTAEFALQPTSVGPASVSLQVPGRERLSASIFVMP